MSGNSTQPFTVFDEMCRCYNTTAGNISFIVFSVINISLTLPLCIFVLYLGLLRWRQRTLNSMSHCDILTYNIILIDLLQITGSMIFCYNIHIDSSGISVSAYMLSIYITGQMMFFPLTCVDYYLAVIFPIFYMSLKKPKFIRARNITIGLGWLCSFVQIFLLRVLEQTQMVPLLSVISFFLLSFIVFSCFSVLYVLIRPGPGEGGRDQVHQSKLKAFNTIIAILTVLTIRFLGAVICNCMFGSSRVGEEERCFLSFIIIGIGLPCSLMQPILFLQRTGKLPFCKNNNSRRHL